MCRYSDKLPQVGETVIGSQFRSTVGGNGANQAVAAAKLGANVSLIAMVGADDFGASCINYLRDVGVHTGNFIVNLSLYL